MKKFSIAERLARFPATPKFKAEAAALIVMLKQRLAEETKRADDAEIRAGWWEDIANKRNQAIQNLTVQITSGGTSQ